LASSTITFILSLIGTLSGTAGVVLGVLNYLRDRPVAVVGLRWDLEALDKHLQPAGPPVGVVSVVNKGRRPLFIKLVYLQTPRRSGRDQYLLVPGTQQGQKLTEGDPELVLPLREDVQTFLRQNLAADWAKIYAVAEDNCGRKYRSKAPGTQPSWARPLPAAGGEEASRI
jgi:hypothetical protein